MTVDPRVRGESYKIGVYEDAIGQAFEHVAPGNRGVPFVWSSGFARLIKLPVTGLPPAHDLCL